MNDVLWRAVFEDLSRAVEYWASLASAVLVDPNNDAKWANNPASFSAVRGTLGEIDVDQVNSLLTQAMQGLMHSTLAVFDGATASAEIGRVRLVDETDSEIEGALHEEFVGYLLDNGKMT